MTLAFVTGCSKPDKYDELSGTWVPISQEIGGTELPQAALTNQSLVLEGRNYTMTAESVDKGTILIEGNRMDVNGSEGPNAGKTFKAIYKLENENLMICYNLQGDRYPEAFKTEGEPMFFLATFKKK